MTLCFTGTKPIILKIIFTIDFLEAMVIKSHQGTVIAYCCNQMYTSTIPTTHSFTFISLKWVFNELDFHIFLKKCIITVGG